jgi:hypothetical protein
MSLSALPQIKDGGTFADEAHSRLRGTSPAANRAVPG